MMVSPPKAVSPSRPLRAVVVGAGAAATAMHLPVLGAQRDRGALTLACICELDAGRAEMAKTRFGFQEASGDAQQAIARGDCDVVYIFGSAQTHHALGMAALRAGKHLFVEKPVAPSFAEAWDLVEAAQTAGVIAVGGHNRRFYRAFKLLRERSGSLGWRYAEAVFHRAECAKPAAFGARTWLGANGIHALDAMLFMMGGLPDHLSAQAGDTLAGRPSTFSAVMRWRDGAQGVFLCNNNAGARREEYSFHRGGASYRVSEEQVLIQTGSKEEKLAVASLGDGVLAEHEAFLNAVRSGDAPAHALSAIAPALFLAELIESGFSGNVLFTPQKPCVAGARHGQSVLVAKAAPLLPAIARMLPHHRLVAVEELKSPAQRPDVVAALLGSGADPLGPEILAKLPQLKVIGVMGLSLQRHSPQALLDRGLTLVNASAAYANSVAEFALALAVLGRRRAFASHELMRAGGWGTGVSAQGIKATAKRLARHGRPVAKALRVESFLLRRWRRAFAGATPTGPGELSAATVGLIGWGAIAQQLTRHLTTLGARVSVYSEHGSARDIKEAGASPVSLSEALVCDIVSLHRGLTPATRHSLGARELALLRPGAVLINVARGALIEPRALLARLKRGDVVACLDTFEEEPLAAGDRLRRLPNVFLTSHIAGGSKDMHAAAAEEVVQKVARHLEGQAVEGISLARLGTMT